MDTSSEDERASPEPHTAVVPQPYTGFESSEDELAGGVISEQSSISAPISNDVSLTHLWVSISDTELRDRRKLPQWTPPILQI
jgi:hypothetical protein